VETLQLYCDASVYFVCLSVSLKSQVLFICKFWQEFLRSEFSEENLLFWIKCEEYRKLNDANQVC